MMQAFYSTYSNTIRKIPENYCLIDFRPDEESVIQFYLDGAAVPYRDYVKNVYGKWRDIDSNYKNVLAKMVSDEIENNYKYFVDQF